MILLVRGEKTYQNTCLQIPYDLKIQAKKQGINMTQVLVRGIEKELQSKRSARDHAATTPKAPCTPSNTDQQVDV